MSSLRSQTFLLFFPASSVRPFKNGVKHSPHDRQLTMFRQGPQNEYIPFNRRKTKKLKLFLRMTIWKFFLELSFFCKSTKTFQGAKKEDIQQRYTNRYISYAQVRRVCSFSNVLFQFFKNENDKTV